MNILASAKHLRNTLSDLQPNKVAVAFVGTGWKKYISAAHLQEIVLSPTLGSNPKAIEELIEEIGLDRVHFLDELHSKIYLGEKGALLGSCNLSDNGISDAGLLEAAVFLQEPTALRQLEATFNNYKTLALRRYPTQAAKKEKLRVLVKEWNIAVWHGLVAAETSSPFLKDYRSGLDRIHIVWHSHGELEYDNTAIGAVVPDAGESPDDYFSSVLQFLEDDHVEPGDWVLSWHCRNDGYPRKNGDVSWLHVHHVVPHGVVGDTYTKLVGQASHLNRGAPPFELDPPTKKRIRAALESGRFPALLSLDDEVWHQQPADDVTPEFLIYLREAQEPE